MSKKFDFQYIVIGSGPAGRTAATTLAKAKKGVALIEKRFFGGTDLNSIDIPYKVALKSAHTYYRLNSSPEFKNQDFTLNLPTIVSNELRAVVNAGGNKKEDYEKTGVVCLKGNANLLDSHTLAVGDKKITFHNLIIATGSHLRTNEISGTDSVSFLTPENAIRIRRLPSVVAVVGAGSTGCEIASYYSELGSKVILFETSNRILPKEDPEVGENITNFLTRNLGVNCLTNCKVVAIGEDQTSKYVIFQYGASEKIVRVEQIALATGSLPNTDLGLENANVKYKNSGIVVNKLFETSAKNIYAIGDCIGGESSTERSYQQGITLATNLIKHTKNPVNYAGTIRSINTYLQVATVGLNEEDLIKRDRKYKKSIVQLNETVIGKIEIGEYGFVKIFSDHNNSIVGASIVAPNATLLAQELALAIRHHHTAIELASTPHEINGYSFAIKQAARQLILKKH